MIGHGIDRAIHSGELAGQILSKGFQIGCTVDTITRSYENNLECRRVEWRRSFKTMDNMIGEWVAPPSCSPEVCSDQ